MEWENLSNVGFTAVPCQDSGLEFSKISKIWAGSQARYWYKSNAGQVFPLHRAQNLKHAFGFVSHNNISGVAFNIWKNEELSSPVTDILLNSDPES